MKWIVTLLSLVVFLSSALSIYFWFNVAIPSLADLSAETKEMMPSWGMVETYGIAKEILTIVLAVSATYLTWKK